MKIWLIFFLSIGVLPVSAQVKKVASIKSVSAENIRMLIDTSRGPLIVNFWATWCAPCLHEIRWFDSIIAVKKAPVKLVLVSLDFRSEYPDRLTSFVRRQGYNGEVMYLHDTNMGSYIQTIEPKWKGAIPASIFVNHNNGYYQVFNDQVPMRRFALELEKLTGAEAPAKRIDQ